MMKYITTTILLSAALLSGSARAAEPAAGAVSLYTLSDMKDPTFEELVQTHGEKSKDGKLQLSLDVPIPGSKVDVNNKYLEEGLGKVSNPHDIKKLGIDTAMGHLKAQEAAEKYTRWYQLDGNTQIYRLFKGDKGHTLKKACRSESTGGRFSTENQVVVWEGSYCVPIPGTGTLAFQLWIEGARADGLSYPFYSIRAGEEYKSQHSNIKIQKPWSGQRHHTFVKDGTGKRVAIRFRYDGHYYELSNKEPGGEWAVIDGGTLRAPGKRVGFRWGAYTGQAEHVLGDKLIFVTGAKVYTEKGSIKPPSWVPADKLSERTTPPAENASGNKKN